MKRFPLSNLLYVFLLLLLTASPIWAQTPAEDLINAINTGDEKKAILLLKKGANPNARDELTQPAIAAAAYFGRERIVRALLASGADFRAVDSDGLNVLHAAAAGGHPVIASLLLDRGLAINERGGTDGMTALANAAARGHLPVMRLLLERRADVNLADSGGNTPLLHAALRGRTEAVRLLLAHGAKVNVASKHGWTPLMTAAWEGHTMIVKELLKHGADTKLMTTERRSAQMLAESEGHREIVKLLAGK
ncbi:MAG: ankyrin repeat domain-containing protein [Acidobacteria bacterium]|nr:ankyrin repeat domain-containing protein [Acidobacteriota bacterium]MCW5969403.1 ankyrin repeat domain-containing protein [Blastocatellales bacterium]